MLKLKYFIPIGLKDLEEVRKTKNFLDDLKSKQIFVSTETIDKNGESNLKSRFLWSLATYKKIRIKQTQKTKSLYPTLVVFDGNDKPLTFYPQKRANEEITISEFLDGLSKKKIKSIHEKGDIESNL